MQPQVATYVERIATSGRTIYEPIEIGSELYIPSRELQLLLDPGLRGFSTDGLKLRTRSKVVKQRVCEILGYPVPASFQKTQPRFPGQDFDTYIQKSNNLQIWNEQLSATRRYVIIREQESAITSVRVVTGETLAMLDKTGTLTQKYQARMPPGEASELVSNADTPRLHPLLTAADGAVRKSNFNQLPTAYPDAGQILPIASIYDRLSLLVGETFPDCGYDQERNRGADLHRLVCASLYYGSYADDGRFPDVRHQLVEVKLQTSPTIDLGLVTPDSQDPLDVPQVNGVQLRHCDVRYAVFDATINDGNVLLKRLLLVTGERFFSRFQRFEGRVLNRKLQIPLPRNFFDSEGFANVGV